MAAESRAGPDRATRLGNSGLIKLTYGPACGGKHPGGQDQSDDEKAQIRRKFDRLELLLAQIKQIEAERDLEVEQCRCRGFGALAVLSTARRLSTVVHVAKIIFIVLMWCIGPEASRRKSCGCQYVME
ncbi:MAG: hypothetical protein E5Y16_11010 [Mesorhizobium sp.]|uniref:hypothetical protein n=1 Tax=Mesorhizobium sp. TaxID=1871066 RepID=UPI00121F6801|nr:hypothetical protein [Mesorhizobium sp.]TIQ03263.1 MAG: hypothetical protein E5X57_31215 [Mesorhizobium sp.]TJV40872.1 MAG: hypothetical protein E5Y16_11010 [Mesorhizobium sp.]